MLQRHFGDKNELILFHPKNPRLEFKILSNPNYLGKKLETTFELVNMTFFPINCEVTMHFLKLHSKLLPKPIRTSL